ncbi:MAG TPA: hypothetical protein VD948_11400 [Rhodothermales bacterium]|nr:hypothetical protein [Rhodothermales bacterium]
MKYKTLQDYLAEQFKDPDFAREYEKAREEVRRELSEPDPDCVYLVDEGYPQAWEMRRRNRRGQ